MASPPSPQPSPMSKSLPSAKSLAMGTQLLTPEEPMLESFGSTLPPMKTNNVLLSPVSPAYRTIESASEQGFSPRDPPLYPDHNIVGAVDKPLFENVSGTQRDSQSPAPSTPHVAPLRVRQSDRVPASPVALFNDFGMDYWRHCVNQLDSYRIKKILPPPEIHSQDRDRFTTDQLSRLDRVIGNSRVQKPRPAPRPVSKPKIAASATVSPHSAPRAETPAKRTHRRKAATPETSSASPDAKPRTRAPATKKKDGVSADAWYSVEDYCPPVSSLDNCGTSLVLPESSNAVRPLDLSNDPDRGHLDLRELELASALRLQCNLYLLCKRRIFAAKLQWLRDARAGKDIKGDFNKTAAQTVCTIDVNKVSKLWTAFNRVGWFDEHWFEKWL